MTKEHFALCEEFLLASKFNPPVTYALHAELPKDDWSYCYEFTWFGPDYDNITRYNGTCADYLDETRADGIPCAAPIMMVLLQTWIGCGSITEAAFYVKEVKPKSA
ncbi:hypothetical protein NQ317_009088 [Molorchus minor]|uniref:Uncharacterized protein n=1 Tax=Molorchus minor TaxID=1323400 RepID=A0ABQ9IX63_9CUCU|nr:hypothetical protein NQ317_009088 [Molorchus minor]